MKIEIKHLGDVQFSVETRGHTMYSDQPTDNGGYDEGMTPPEMFLGALGACAAFYAVAYLKRMGVPHEGTRVDATAEKLKNPARLGGIVLHVITPEPLTEEHQAGVNDAVHRCILHNTLTHPPEMKTVISGAAEAVTQ